MVETVGMISAVLLPFFDIPLIWRIMKRQSSEDISLVWTFGIWACTVGMLPASLRSADHVLKAFGIVNLVLFTGVVVAVVRYHPVFRRRKL